MFKTVVINADHGLTDESFKMLNDYLEGDGTQNNFDQDISSL